MNIINGVKCRTGRESLEHIIKQAKKGKIGPNIDKGDAPGSCNYRYASGNNCVVGSLFSKAQLQDIQARGANSYNVDYVATRGTGCVGWRNLEAVTGLTRIQLMALQGVHDKANMGDRTQKIVEACEEALKTGTLAHFPVTQ